jgi:hypothetical protein
MWYHLCAVMKQRLWVHLRIHPTKTLSAKKIISITLSPPHTLRFAVRFACADLSLKRVLESRKTYLACTVFGIDWSKSVSAWFFLACTSKSSCKLERVCRSLDLCSVFTPCRMNRVGFADHSSFLSHFIEIYKQHECLWKIKSKEHSDRNKKYGAYELLIKNSRKSIKMRTKIM